MEKIRLARSDRQGHASAPVAALAHRHFVEEAFFCWRTDAEVAAVVSFRGLAKDVSGRVPENPFAFFRVKVEQLKRAIAFERAIEIPHNR